MKITRDEIKSKVINTAYFSIGDYFETTMNTSPNDGEDLLLYNEVGFDSLDMVEFILSIETYYKFSESTIQLPDNLFNKEVTLRKVIDYIWKTLNNK